MSALKARLAVLSNQDGLMQSLKDYEPVYLNHEILKRQEYYGDVILIDSDYFWSGEITELQTKKINSDFQKKIFILPKNKKSSAPKNNWAGLSALTIERFLHIEDISTDFLNSMWQEIRQKEQDETYLSLSAELNQQYEILKTELENKLHEKSKNIIESRKQIFEINNRVEVLRKSLYSTTEVKSLAEAESALNDLLVKFGMITWFKIIRQEQAQAFEKDLREKFESTLYSSKISISNEVFYLYFFKGDKRPFRKSDLNYFNKLTEALQINLNRYNNLLALQQNERLFDLAFHSSPHPIIVIDNDYHVYQANLAAEKNSEDFSESARCYELLFKQNKPCAGCRLGSKFEIQKDFNTYAVQSNKYTNSLDTEHNYWIHLYENVSEQRALENKYQQTAKLSEVGLISSSIAHELNNPLGGILSYLQIMKMEIAADHPFQQDIQFLTEAALRMKKHIEDLLFFSRKEDAVKLERVELHDVLHKNLDLLQMQLKKEHLIVSFQPDEKNYYHDVSILHFRNIIHLVFQFFSHKLRLKRQNKSGFSGLVEVKVSQDQTDSYVSFNSNLGPHDIKLNTNDLSLITLEKSILDQGFQLVISEPQPLWLQLLIKLPRK